MIAFTLSRTTAKFFLSQPASQRQTDEKFLMIAWICLTQPTSCEFLSFVSAAQNFLHFYIIRLFISFDFNCVKCN